MLIALPPLRPPLRLARSRRRHFLRFFFFLFSFFLFFFVHRGSCRGDVLAAIVCQANYRCICAQSQGRAPASMHVCGDLVACVHADARVLLHTYYSALSW